MRRADLVADHLVDLTFDPAKLAQEGVPGAHSELDAVGEHRGRVGRRELEEVMRGERLERLDAPAAKAMKLGCRLGRSAHQPARCDRGRTTHRRAARRPLPNRR